MSIVGANIRKRREDLGLSQHDLAKILKSSQKNVWAIETGANSPTEKTVIKYAEALEIEPFELYKPTPPDEE